MTAFLTSLPAGAVIVLVAIVVPALVAAAAFGIGSVFAPFTVRVR